MDALPPEIVTAIVQYADTPRALSLTCSRLATITFDVVRRSDCARILEVAPALAVAPKFVVAFQRLVALVRIIDIVTGIHAISDRCRDAYGELKLYIHLALGQQELASNGCDCIILGVRGPIDCKWCRQCDFHMFTCAQSLTPEMRQQLHSVSAQLEHTHKCARGQWRYPMRIGWSNVRGFTSI